VDEGRGPVDLERLPTIPRSDTWLREEEAVAKTVSTSEVSLLGNRYDGEDVSTKNPFTKALARVQSHAGRPAS